MSQKTKPANDRFNDAADKTVAVPVRYKKQQEQRDGQCPEEEAEKIRQQQLQQPQL